jgi:hypothetical protein
MVSAIEDSLRGNVPVNLKGLPGIGKTEIITATVAAFTLDGKRYGLEVQVPSSWEPSDCGGLPIIGQDGTVSFAMPAWARRLHTMAGQGLIPVLYLDEITCCHPALQAPLLRLIREKRMNDWALPTETRILLASNPPEFAANGNDLSAPMVGRMSEVPVSADFDAWAQWNVGQPNPNGIRSEVMGFLKARPALFCPAPKPTGEDISAPRPSPRAWDNFCKVTTEAVRSGLIGGAAHAEFVQWQRNADLPSPEDVLNGKAQLPQRSDARYAVLSAIASLAAREYKAFGDKAWAVIIGVADKALDEALVPARALAIAAPSIPPQLGKLAGAIGKITK